MKIFLTIIAASLFVILCGLILNSASFDGKTKKIDKSDKITKE